MVQTDRALIALSAFYRAHTALTLKQAILAVARYERDFSLALFFHFAMASTFGNNGLKFRFFDGRLF